MIDTAKTWDLVLSYGDLSRGSGYKTRVLGELEHLDENPFLLLFDRHPEEFTRNARIDVPFRAIPRAAMLRFYPEAARLARQKPIRLVHAHNLYSAALAISARGLHHYRVILDYHGRIPEEYVFLGKGGDTSRRALESLEAWTVRRADHIVTVSGRLADYIKDRYKIQDSKISVIPCAADSRLFRWDAELRRQTRQRLKLDGRFVCAHLGSFFEWYEPDFLMRTFAEIRHTFPDAHLMVVTNEVVRAQEYLEARLARKDFNVLSAEHRDVPALLNASDAGFLLLRSTPNIQTSSPVKFAEYLNCGLPVLITPHVGDYSELVARSGAGAIVNNVDATDLSILKRPREELAARCTAAGAPLTWQALGGAWKGAVANCVSVSVR